MSAHARYLGRRLGYTSLVGGATGRFPHGGIRWRLMIQSARARTGTRRPRNRATGSFLEDIHALCFRADRARLCGGPAGHDARANLGGILGRRARVSYLKDGEDERRKKEKKKTTKPP